MIRAAPAKGEARLFLGEAVVMVAECLGEKSPNFIMVLPWGNRVFELLELLALEKTAKGY